MRSLLFKQIYCLRPFKVFVLCRLISNSNFLWPFFCCGVELLFPRVLGQLVNFEGYLLQVERVGGLASFVTSCQKVIMIP